MVSYLMKKHTDDNGTTRNDGGRIRYAHDLYRLALISALRSERESLFKMEATSLQLPEGSGHEG